MRRDLAGIFFPGHSDAVSPPSDGPVAVTLGWMPPRRKYDPIISAPRSAVLTKAQGEGYIGHEGFRRILAPSGLRNQAFILEIAGGSRWRWTGAMSIP